MDEAFKSLLLAPLVGIACHVTHVTVVAGLITAEDSLVIQFLLAPITAPEGRKSCICFIARVSSQPGQTQAANKVGRERAWTDCVPGPRWTHHGYAIRDRWSAVCLS